VPQVYGAGLAVPAVALVHAPVALLPVPYPEATFLLAKRAALAFNTLIDRVSRDDDYLRQVLEPAARFDDFTVSVCRLMEFRRRRARSLPLALLLRRTG
jgi:glutathione synthase